MKVCGVCVHALRVRMHALCMHACMYVWCACVCASMCGCMRMCMHACMYTRMHACMHAHTHASTHTCVFDIENYGYQLKGFIELVLCVKHDSNRNTYLLLSTYFIFVPLPPPRLVNINIILTL